MNNCTCNVYQEIGYQCLRVSSTEMKGIDKLKAMIGKVVCSLDIQELEINIGKCHGAFFCI
jgi:hypothetical protein